MKYQRKISRVGFASVALAASITARATVLETFDTATIDGTGTGQNGEHLTGDLSGGWDFRLTGASTTSSIVSGQLSMNPSIVGNYSIEPTSSTVAIGDVLRVQVTKTNRNNFPAIGIGMSNHTAARFFDDSGFIAVAYQRDGSNWGVETYDSGNTTLPVYNPGGDSWANNETRILELYRSSASQYQARVFNSDGTVQLGSTVSGAANNFQLTGNPNLRISLISSSGAAKFDNVEVIHVTGRGWVNSDGGDWHAPANWIGAIPNGLGQEAIFGGAISSPRTVYADSPVQVGSLRFNNTSKYVIAGAASLTITGSRVVEDFEGDLPTTFTSPSAGTTLNQTSATGNKLPGGWTWRNFTNNANNTFKIAHAGENGTDELDTKDALGGGNNELASTTYQVGIGQSASVRITKTGARAANFPSIGLGLSNKSSGTGSSGRLFDDNAGVALIYEKLGSNHYGFGFEGLGTNNGGSGSVFDTAFTENWNLADSFTFEISRPARDQFITTLYDSSGNSLGSYTASGLTGTLNNGSNDNLYLNLSAGSAGATDEFQFDNVKVWSASETEPANPGLIEVQAGTHKINLPLVISANTTVRVVTGGTLEIADPVTVNAGKILTQTGGGTVAYSSTVHVLTGGSITFGNSNHMAGLTVDATGLATVTSGGDKLLNTDSLSVSGQLDLKDNKLITRTSLGSWNTTNYTGVLGMAKAGRVGNWTGQGLITSMTDATVSGKTTLAVASADELGRVGSTFGGTTLASGDTLVMYTWAGDANLSGFVDADDYFQIDSNYNKPATTLDFFKGDLNYDGRIDGDDFSIIDASYSSQGSPIGSSAPFGGAGLAAVPEPAGLNVLFAAVAVAQLRRTRRAQKD